MKEALAIVIVILMWAFAATKAEWYFEDPSYNTLLSPVYEHIQDNPSNNWNNEITTLSTYITTAESEYVKAWLSKVVLFLIKQQEKNDTTLYSAFLDQ